MNCEANFSTIFAVYAAILLGLLAIGLIEISSVMVVLIFACVLFGVYTALVSMLPAVSDALPFFFPRSCRLFRILLEKRASMWFSGMIAAMFMTAAGVAYGFLDHHQLTEKERLLNQETRSSCVE